MTSYMDGSGAPAAIMAYAERARAYAASSKAENTRLGYRKDCADFCAWCAAKGVRPVPAQPMVVLAYLIDVADRLKVSTPRRRLSAIRDMHRNAGHDLETGHAGFREAWRGICRTKGAPAAKKAPLLTTDLRRLVAALPAETLSGARDRAILLIGFAAALRRSELAALRVSPALCCSFVELTGDGLLVHVARSKTDQTGEGSTIGVPFGTHPETCPVLAWRCWLTVSGIQDGAAFRQISRHGRLGARPITGEAVALVLKRAVTAASRDGGASAEQAVAEARRFSGHSLRSGLATSAASNDVPGHVIQAQLRHKSFETTAGYIQAGRIRRRAGGTHP
ncbi:tyrosine-type recombinase/integrase [Alsobacter sp. SYSU BS001988]